MRARATGAAPAEATPAFDGTLPPHGAIMSVFLADEEGAALAENPAFEALRAYYAERFTTLWSSYGPRSSFDPQGNVSALVVGIEKGPEALGIEAWRTGRPARELAANPAIAAALALVFEGSPCPLSGPFVRGRVNAGDGIDISDPVYLLEFLFSGGPPPVCEDAADVNDDGTLDVSDPVYLLGYLFSGTSAPPAPFPAPGPDPTPDSLAECRPSAD